MNDKEAKPEQRTRRPWQIALSNFFRSAWVEASVGLLVVCSVGLTLFEFTLGEAEHAQLLRQVEVIADGITIVFGIELYLRFICSTSTRRFFREYWLDLLAIMPFFRAFRAFRLLRLLRILRLFGVVSRLASHFPYVLRRGAIEYMVTCALLAVTVLFGTGAMMYFERGTLAAEGGAFNLTNSFWFSLYSLFAGEPVPTTPATVGGKVTAVFVMFMGLTIFAMFTGTVSAFMVERLRMEDTNVDFDSLQDHIIVCGWNSKAMIIVREYRASPNNQSTPIVVITEFEERPELPAAIERGISFLNEDFTKIAALERAGIHRATTCIVLADTAGGRSEQDADARTILAALTVEKLNEDVYTCAELLNPSYGSHLKMGGVNDFVVSGEYGAYLLAQASMNRGLMEVYSELLTYEHGNEIYRLAIPDQWIGHSFREAMIELKDRYNAILVGVYSASGKTKLNPKSHLFVEGDEVVVIALDEFQLDPSTPGKTTPG